MSNREHEEYWKNYTNLQFVKHNVLKSYLGGWYPILSSWHGRIAYIDCHAGRGKHETGEEGSPNSVAVEIERADYEDVINQILDNLEAEEQPLAPAFVFVDPFGFKLSMELMNRLLSFRYSELFINFMFRYVDMAMRDEAQETNMNNLFGCEDWKRLSKEFIPDYEERAKEVIRLYTEQLQAEYTTWVRMIGEHRELKYVLIHASHHPKGKQLMKEAIWSTLPGGEFTAYQSDNPYQGLLIKPEPDLAPLEDRVWEVCTGRQIYYKELLKEINLIETIYLEKHLKDILRRLKNEKIIDASGYEGKFAFKGNPLFEFPFFRPMERK